MKLCYPLNLPFQISQKFGENPYYYSQFKDAFGVPNKGHNGWDFSVPEGTPVYATHDGKIQFSGIDSTMSLTIIIEAFDGTYKTYYCHLSESKVSFGQQVKQGELIALSGNTGRYTTGPHLHFGIHLIPGEPGNGYSGAVDPLSYFDGSYPSTPQPVAVLPQDTPFLVMQRAILAFQLSEGITDFKNAPLKDVLYGNKTLQATKKYK